MKVAASFGRRRGAGHIRVIAAAAAVALALATLSPAGAWACSCQKEYMIKKHGTLSVLDLPERPEPAAGDGDGVAPPAPAQTQPATLPPQSPAGG